MCAALDVTAVSRRVVAETLLQSAECYFGTAGASTQLSSLFCVAAENKHRLIQKLITSIRPFLDCFVATMSN